MSNEEYLINALIEGKDVSDFKCKSRIETILKNCCMNKDCKEMTPKSRIEVLLKSLADKIASGGTGGSGGGEIYVPIAFDIVGVAISTEGLPEAVALTQNGTLPKIYKSNFSVDLETQSFIYEPIIETNEVPTMAMQCRVGGDMYSNGLASYMSLMMDPETYTGALYYFKLSDIETKTTDLGYIGYKNDYFTFTLTLTPTNSSGGYVGVREFIKNPMDHTNSIGCFEVDTNSTSVINGQTECVVKLSYSCAEYSIVIQ